jgi:hypothetical protein
VSGATGYDLVAGDLAEIRRTGGRTTLRVSHVLLARGQETSVTEPAGMPSPPPGHALFYLVQYHDERGPTGYGTASAPWPVEVALPDP